MYVRNWPAPVAIRSRRRRPPVGPSNGGKPGLLAHVLVAKFNDHLPLYRQSAIYAREGVELGRSLLAKWVGQSAKLLQPLVDALRVHVMAATKLHADDTPVPVLAPGNGKTKTGRLRVYVRDDRNSGDKTPPAVWFAYTPDRKGEHPQQHLVKFKGTLQADAYGGYQKIYETGNVLEAACWAHARRKFYDLYAARPNALNKEALERIGALYQIEETIRGKLPDERREQRTCQTATRAVPYMAECYAGNALAQIRHESGDSLCPEPVGGVDALLRRRATGNRQSTGRASIARRGFGPPELSVRRRGLRRRTGGRDLQPDRHVQTQ